MLNTWRAELLDTRFHDKDKNRPATDRLTLLGTGRYKPDPERGASVLLVRIGGRALLFDAGRGVTRALLPVGVAPRELDEVFLPHHHYDHIGNLGYLLLSIWNAGRTRPLAVYGPAGTAAIIEALFKVVAADVVADFNGKVVLGVDGLNIPLFSEGRP